MAFTPEQCRELRAKRRELEQCQHCGKPLDGESRALCDYHHKRYIRMQTLRRKERRGQHRCIHCGKRTMFTRVCYDCRKTNIGSRQRRRDREREQRDKRRENNQCTKCGTPIDREVDGDCLQCAICRGGLYAMA
jgi:hypothetical protein